MEVRAGEGEPTGRPSQAAATFHGGMRFSVISHRTRFAWSATHGMSGEDAAAVVFAETRLAARFRLFEAITLPFFRHASRNGIAYRLTILASTLLPKPWRNRLETSIRDIPQISCVYLEPHQDPLKAFQRVVAASVAPGQKTVCTFRIDDDDALNTSYFEDLARVNTPENIGKVITHELGLFVGHDPVRGLVVNDVKFTAVALGLAHIADPSDARTIYDLGSHSKLREHHALEVFPAPRAWIRTVHPSMDTALSKFEYPDMTRWRSIFEIEDKFRRLFPFIDLDQMAEAMRLAVR